MQKGKVNTEGKVNTVRVLTPEEVKDLVERVKTGLRRLGPEICEEAPGLSAKARGFTIDY